MIFVTVGTHHQPFTRLLDALAALDEDVVVQYGHSNRPTGVREAFAFLGFAEMLERVRTADCVVTHAGVGSILLARREGHTPVVVPRRREHAEHVDNHQVELTHALASGGEVLPVWDAGLLPAVVASAPTKASARMSAPGALHMAVRAALVGCPCN